VLSFGADDAHNYMTGVPAGASIGALGSASWDAEYRRRVEGVIRELKADGVYVVWLGLPIVRGPTQNHSFQLVNKVVRAVVAKHPDSVAYINTYRMFETPRGRYADYLQDAHGHLALMRSGDGVHYQPAAGDLIAQAVFDRLATRFDQTGRPRSTASGRS
jgi:hypothetical protein